MRTNRTWAAMVAVLVVACGASVAPRPNAADVARISERWPNASLDELERGRSLYLSRCTSCHAPVDPASIPAELWPDQVEEMKQRSQLGEESELVVKYLVSRSLHTGNVAKRDDAGP